MKNRFVALAAALLVLSSCKPAAEAPPKADQPPSKADAFRKSTIAEVKGPLGKLYNAALNEDSVKVLTAPELDKWIKGGPWKDRTLPCEIQAVLSRPGAVDPSPIALDVSGSAQKPGTGLIYVPIPRDVNCDSPKNGFFLDDLKDCPDSEKNLVCNGQGPKGDACRCFCAFGCAQTTACDACDAVPAIPAKS
jgi:hypothetical protein